MSKSNILRSFGIFVLILLYIVSECKETPKRPYPVILNSIIALDSISALEKITTDLNGDNRLDTITCMSPPDGDPGQFRKIVISLSGSGQQIFSAKDVWDFVDTVFANRNANAVSSDKVFVFKNQKQSLILLFGFVYGSGRDEFSIIQIRNNKAKMIFDDKLEIPLKIYASANDNTVELLGRCFGEYVSDSTETYHPYSIYTIAGDSCYLNRSLTQKYNEENYVWAGMDYNASVIVSRPLNGIKPRIIR